MIVVVWCVGGGEAGHRTQECVWQSEAELSLVWVRQAQCQYHCTPPPPAQPQILTTDQCSSPSSDTETQCCRRERRPGVIIISVRSAPVISDQVEESVGDSVSLDIDLVSVVSVVCCTELLVAFNNNMWHNNNVVHESKQKTVMYGDCLPPSS